MNYVKGMFEKAQETRGIDLMQLVSFEGRKRQHSQSHLDQQNKHLSVTETITFFSDGSFDLKTAKSYFVCSDLFVTYHHQVPHGFCSIRHVTPALTAKMEERPRERLD